MLKVGSMLGALLQSFLAAWDETNLVCKGQTVEHMVAEQLPFLCTVLLACQKPSLEITLCQACCRFVAQMNASIDSGKRRRTVPSEF